MLETESGFSPEDSEGFLTGEKAAALPDVESFLCTLVKVSQGCGFFFSLSNSFLQGSEIFFEQCAESRFVVGCIQR